MAKFAKLPWMVMLRCIGGAAGAVLTALGIYHMFTFVLAPKTFVDSFYQILFGLLIIFSELRWKKIVFKWFGFLTSFLGLGLFHVFVGGIALGDAWYEIVLTIFFCSCGGIYILLGCGCRKMFPEGLALGADKDQAQDQREMDAESGASNRKKGLLEDAGREAVVQAYNQTYRTNYTDTDTSNPFTAPVSTGSSSSSSSAPSAPSKPAAAASSTGSSLSSSSGGAYDMRGNSKSVANPFDASPFG